MPIWKQEEAKDTGGFAQVREALQKFEGDVLDIIEGQYAPRLDDEGNPMPPREYVDVLCINNKVLETTEPLSMDISQKYSFRINCSDAKNSFWVDKWLASADKAKLLMPDGIKGKRIVFKKVTQVAKNPQYNYTSYIIDKVLGTVALPQTADEVPTEGTAPAPAPVQTATTPTGDPMVIALELAVGKTEAQFRSAAALHEAFIGSPFLQLAKAGALTQTLVNEGKLKLVDNIYQKA